MAGKSNGVESEWARAPPPSLPVCQRLARAFYNPDEKSFLGRTPKRWGIVLTFYLVFYAVLSLMFAACMAGLFATIDPTKPTHTLEHSLIGVNPGVAFRPVGEDGKVKYTVENSTSQKYYIDMIAKFMEPYTSAKLYTEKDDCRPDSDYGYPRTPCIFVKLNRIYDWKPDYYNASDMPEDMPQSLKTYIEDPETEPKQVWISCQEEKSNTTLIEYPWGRGLSSKYYPYVNAKGYLSPLLAIKITPPMNELVIIRCRAWAKNIIYSKSIKEPRGYTRIQLLVEEETSIIETTTVAE